MKKIILGLGMLAATASFSQISEGGLPTTFEKVVVGEKRAVKIDYQVVELAKPNLAQVMVDDAEDSEKGKPYRVSILQPVSLDILNSGTWKTLANGDKIWRLGIKIPDAQALSLYFSEAVAIPKGGKLHAYNANHSQFVGAYSANTPTFYAMEMIEGELITLEYYLPYGSTELPNIKIGNVAYYYRGVEDRVAAFREGQAVYKQHQSCEVDVACSEIAGWESQRDAVVHYSFVSGGNGYVCSGAVINNTANDCTPYILTANHCGEPTSNSNINNHTWYFNYQRPTCVPGNTAQYTGARSQTMSGGMLRSSSQLGNYVNTGANQVSGADFALIELNNNIPAAYNAYFAGWNRASSSPTSGVGIHHPAGDEKKISTYSSVAISSTYNSGWANAHWRVTWVSTANGHGVTEGGSSGSPLFNQNGLIVGHLSGGASFCTSPNSPDLYGKMNRAWDQEGTNANERLKPWLDPSNTGATSLAGAYSPCSGGGGSIDHCNATSTSCDEYIENVTLNTINKTSGCNNYSNFTSTSTTLSRGQTYTLNIGTAIVGSTNPAYTNDEVAAWIDWNNDGDFTDNGERVAYVLIANGASTSFTFTVPNSAASGNLKMRVRISYSPDDGPISPCGTSAYGEVEDYTVVIPGTNAIDELHFDLVKIYPNPTQENFTIDLQGLEDQITSIVVTDLRGRKLVNLSSVTANPVIDLLREPSGIYIVQLKTNFGTYSQKVVKF
ncbi:MAG: GEVED domain-containing protein [Flavobacteriales bacterium]|jgi:hypothetical protein|nr:GEVED domain-containing protein [Flavobacteriales bacterium]